MLKYQNLLSTVLNEGYWQENRTGIDTVSTFARMLKFDLLYEHPLVTTKQGFHRGAKVELAWILKGLTNTKYLHDNNVFFWDQWAIKGPHEQLKPLSELKTAAAITGTEIAEEIYATGDIEAIKTAHPNLVVVNNVDDRFVHMAPTYEYVRDYYMEHHDISSEKAEAIMLDLYLTAHPCQSIGDSITKELVAIEAARQLDLPSTVPVKTCEIGDLGPVYGAMVRKFPNSDGTTTDQLAELIKGLKENPYSRRHLVSLWCPEVLPIESMTPEQNVALGKQALAPCHMLWTFKVSPATEQHRIDWLNQNFDKFRSNNLAALVEAEKQSKGGTLTKEEEFELLLPLVSDKRLNLLFNMRSSDTPVGLPVNLDFYACLNHVVAAYAGMIVGELAYMGCDVHIYEDQIEGVKEQLTREPMAGPSVRVNTIRENVWDFEPNDMELMNYSHHPKIEFKVAK